MKNFGKLVITGLVLLLSFFVFIGCKPAEDEDTDEVKVIKVWVHKSEAEDEGMVYSTIAELFNEQQFKTADGKRILKMKLEFKNSSDTLQTAINAEILSGGLPDIVAVDAPNIAAYADAGILAPIDQYLTSDITSSYVDSVIEQSTIDGKLYALSGMDAPTGMYFNKELLKQVGYEEADFGTVTNPWSWLDVMEAMVALKAANLEYRIKLNLGFGGDEGVMYLYSSLLYSAGGSFFGTNEVVDGALNSANSIKGIKILEMFFAPDGDGESWVYNGSNTDALAGGECAFEIHGPWNISTIKKNYNSFIPNYGIMPMPVFAEGTAKGTPVAGCGSWGFGVTVNSSDPASAAIAVAYLTGTTGSQLMYESIGTFPTHKALLTDLTEFQTGALGSLATILTEIATPRPKMVNYPKVSSSYSKIIEYIETMYGTSEYDLEDYIDTQVAQIDN